MPSKTCFALLALEIIGKGVPHATWNECQKVLGINNALCTKGQVSHQGLLSTRPLTLDSFNVHVFI